MSQLNKKILNVAVIGCGFGRNHIKALANGVDGLRLKTVCDANTARMNAIREDETLKDKLSGVRFTTDCETIFSDPDIDIVSLSLPHHLHEKFAVKAAEAGKHIVLDKPIARTLDEADHIVEAAEKNKVKLLVAFNFRYTPLYTAIQKTLKSGVIGKVLLAVTRHYQRFYYPGDSNWRKSASVGGGCIMGSGVHNIDMLRFCLGDPEEVFAYAVGDAKRLDAEAAATIVYKYAGGTIVNFLCNWVKSSSHQTKTPADVFGEWEFYGEDGELRPIDGELMLNHLDQNPERIEIPEGDGISNLWTHFADCIQNDRTPLTNGRDARASLNLVLKTYESIKTGNPVKIQ